MRQLPLVLALILIGLCGCNNQESEKKKTLLENEQQRLCLGLRLVMSPTQNTLECQQFYQDLN